MQVADAAPNPPAQGLPVRRGPVLKHYGVLVPRHARMVTQTFLRLL